MRRLPGPGARYAGWIGPGISRERSWRQVDELPLRSGAPLDEAGLSEAPADLVDLLVRLNAGSLTDFGIGEANRLGVKQR